jgi:hypothetical protein
MAITDAQQAKQIMMKKGGPVHRHQLAKKRKDGKRPGYYGPDFGHTSDPGTDFGKDAYSEGPSNIDMGGGPGGSDQDFDRARRAIDQRAAEKARREAEEKRRKEEKKKKDIETEKKIQKTKKAKTKKIKDIEVLKDLFEDDEEDIGFDPADTNKDGKVGPIEKLNAFTNRKNVELANKRAFQKFQDIEQYVSPMDEYGITATEAAEKVAADPTYGYDFSDLEKGKEFLGSNIGTSIESYRPNLYDVTSNPGPSVIANLLGKTRPDTQVTALNTLRKARDYRDLAATGKVTQDDLRELRNRGRTDDQIKFIEGGGRDNDPYIPPIIQPVADKKDDETEEEDPFQLALAFRADGGRVPYEDGGYTGGIMDLETGRQMYFLGKLVKKATRAVKKIVKSPVGKIGIGALLMGGAGGFSGLLSKAGGLGGMFSKGLAFAKANPLATSLAGGALAGLLQKGQYKDEDGDGFDDETGLDIRGILKDPGGKGGLQGRFDYGSFKDGGLSDVENDPQYRGWKRVYEVNPEAAKMHPRHRDFVKYYANVDREKKAEGGMMDLKGMEMDFRDDGGFVPIGKKERADDVPARLSKNEFVMTADAVRGAGDGDIDKGAQKMYNLMSKLEAENDQSQGLDGARKMFQTAQRLEEVL